MAISVLFFAADLPEAPAQPEALQRPINQTGYDDIPDSMSEFSKVSAGSSRLSSASRFGTGVYAPPVTVRIEADGLYHCGECTARQVCIEKFHLLRKRRNVIVL